MHVLLLDAHYEHHRYPFATETPAFLLPVVHRSLLRLTLQWLRHHDLGDVTLVTGRNPAEDYDLAATVVDFDLNTAVTVERALARIVSSHRRTEAVLMLRPNLHPLPDLRAIAADHHAKKRGVTFVKGSAVFGPGQYAFGPPALVLLSAIGTRVMANATLQRPLAEIPRMARRKGIPVGHFDPCAPIVEVNNAYALFQANLGSLRMGNDRMLQSRGLRQVRANLWIADGARVGDIKVDPTGGPVIVGANSEIDDGVLMRGPTVIGRGVNVGKRACIHKGLVLDDTYLSNEDFVAESVVSPRMRAKVSSG
ncbi:MAG: hypothetical protein GY898_14490 [Proteobacteria bacterium]|nr:hypothetical protein [Pseudomonadota bacterium]